MHTATGVVRAVGKGDLNSNKKNDLNPREGDLNPNGKGDLNPRKVDLNHNKKVT